MAGNNRKFGELAVGERFRFAFPPLPTHKGVWVKDGDVRARNLESQLSVFLNASVAVLEAEPAAATAPMASTAPNTSTPGE